MRKFIAIILSAALLFTCVFSASLITVTAEVSGAADTVVMPNWQNEAGESITVNPQIEKLPKTVVVPRGKGGATVKAAVNDTLLPVSTFFEISASGHDQVAEFGFEGISNVSGAMMYVKIPNTDAVKVGGPKSADDATLTYTDVNDYRLGFYAVVKTENGADGERKDRFVYSGTPFFYLGVGDTEWKNATVAGYGMKLPMGFEGFVYIPFAALSGYESSNNDDYVSTDTLVGFKITQLTNQNEYNIVWGQDRAFFGYAPESDPLVISAPMMVRGELDVRSGVRITAAEIAKPSTESVVFAGKNYGLFDRDTGNLPATSATNTKITTAMNAGTVSVEAGTNGSAPTLRKLASATPVTNQSSYQLTNYCSDYAWNKARIRQNFKSGTSPKYDGSHYYEGFMFYVELPQIPGDHGLYPEFYQTGQTYAYLNTDPSRNVYKLELGAEKWVSTGERFSKLGNAVTLELDGAAFKGYLYIPFTACNFPLGSVTSSIDGMDINFYNPTDANSADRKFVVSAPILVKSFDSSNTLAYTDDGLINLSTGKFHDNDYFTPDEYYGNPVNNGSADLVHLSAIKMETPDTYSSFFDISKSSGKGDGASYVDSLVPITSAPSFNYALPAGLDDKGFVEFKFGYNGTSAAQEETKMSNLKGIMFYLETPEDKDIVLKLGGRAYDPAYSNKWNASYVVASAKDLKILKETSNSWENLFPNVVNNVATNKYTFKAGFSGYVYFSFDDVAFLTGNKNTVDFVWTLCLYGTTTEAIDLKVSSPFAVTNWSETNAGLAVINGAKDSKGNYVAQELYSDNFAVPYDYNNDFAVNILDLVKSKFEANVADRESFRANYIKDYFK